MNPPHTPAEIAALIDSGDFATASMYLAEVYRFYLDAEHEAPEEFKVLHMFMLTSQVPPTPDHLTIKGTMYPRKTRDSH